LDQLHEESLASAEGIAKQNELAARNGRAADGTAIIATVSEIEDLLSQGFVTKTVRPLGDPLRYAVAQWSKIRPMAESQSTSSWPLPLMPGQPLEREFVDNFESLRLTGHGRPNHRRCTHERKLSIEAAPPWRGGFFRYAPAMKSGATLLSGAISVLWVTGSRAGHHRGEVQLPKTRAAPVMTKRYEVVTKGGVLGTNPPIAVVYLEGNFAQPASLPTKAVTQKDLDFLPALLPIQTGTRVEFPNEDDTLSQHLFLLARETLRSGRYRPDDARFRRKSSTKPAW
jgi:hypothetical protein